MHIERTSDELIIRLPLSIAGPELEALLQYWKVMGILSKAKGTEEEANALAEEANKAHYEKAKKG
jgi:hypothetical protein